MVYIDEYKTLNDINNCLKNPKLDIDIDTYNLLRAFLENPYNTSKEEYDEIQDFIKANNIITEDFQVYYNKDLADTFKHIGPHKPASPTAPVRKITFKKKSLPSEAEIISVDFNPVPKVNVNEMPKVFKKAA